MGAGWIWVVSESGIPYCIKEVQKPESIEDLQWKNESLPDNTGLNKICCTQTSAFAVDSSGNVYLFLMPSVLTIRRRLDVFQNQRWYPAIGWKTPTLVERGQFSDIDGEDMSPEALKLPSDSWVWEDSWTIHISNQTDKEGWEYAFGFGKAAKWKNRQTVGSLVRRRLQKRYMRYAAIARWTKVGDNRVKFKDISVSGTSTNTSLFGVSTNGVVYRRTNISFSSPEGSDWVSMNSIQSPSGFEKARFLASLSSLPCLVVGTESGLLFWRSGIDSVTPSGVVWRQLALPNGKKCKNACLSDSFLFILTEDNEIWNHELELNNSKSGYKMENIQSNCYKLVVASDVISISCSTNDELFCILGDGKIYLKTGISREEPTGRQLVPVFERMDNKNVLWSQISAEGCSEIPSYLTKKYVCLQEFIDFRKCSWRQQILEDLDRLNAFNSSLFDCDEEETSHKTSEDSPTFESKVKVKIGSSNFQESQISVQDNQLSFTFSSSKKTYTLTLDNIRVIEPRISVFPFRYLIFLLLYSSDEAIVSFDSEEQRDKYLDILEKIMKSLMSNAPRRQNFNAIWTVSRTGDARFFPLSELKISENEMVEEILFPFTRSLRIPGIFHRISSGAKRIVWAISREGFPYVLPACWSPFDVVEHDFPLVSSIEYELVEYQQKTLWRGFVPLCTTNGLSAWMCSGKPVPPMFTRLPSKEYSWLDPQWILDEKNGPDGWQYSLKLPGGFSSKPEGKYRRRHWYRKSQYRSKGVWEKTDEIQLRDVYVQKQEAERVFVFGLTLSGEVLLRQGVSADNPKGAVWKHIHCDYKISSLCVVSPFRILAISTDGTLLQRECSSQTDMECVDWLELYKLPYHNVNQIEAIYKTIFLLCGNQLFTHPNTGYKTDKNEVLIELKDKCRIAKSEVGELFVISQSSSSSTICKINAVSIDKPIIERLEVTPCLDISVS